MAVSLAGKTAIVTGAGSGINLAFARALLSRHCNVLFADLNLRPEAQELVSKHDSPSRSPAKAYFQRTNVTQWRDLERMFIVAEKELGEVDVVCPGAGVYEPPWSSFWYPPGHSSSKDPSNSNHYATIDINLTHPIRTTQLALSHFLSRPPPQQSPTSPSLPNTTRPAKSIIHISSIAGQSTPFPALLYNITKHGINALVRTLAPLASDPNINVRATGVAPGVIRTPLWTDNPDKMRLLAASDEWVTPEAVAEVMTRLVETDEVEVDAEHPALASTAVGGGGPAASGDANSSRGGGVSKRRVKVQGGMILEVAAHGRVRVVEPFMDPGPSGAGNTVGNMEMAAGEILERLRKGGWDGRLGGDQE